MSDFDFPLPPPTFEFLVFSLKTQAEMHLGIMSFGEQPEKPNLPAARHSIDLLAMINDKTRGNLSIEEQRLIENSLTELRFRYVQVSEETKAEANKADKINESSAQKDQTAGEPSAGAANTDTRDENDAHGASAS